MSRRVGIYLDTMLWNALCDGAIDARAIMAQLTRTNAELVLSTHTFYELAKSFQSIVTEGRERGRILFSYLREFVDADIPCAKENMELLAAEMWAVKLGRSSVDVFLSKQDFERLRQETHRLAKGDYDERADKFIKERGQFALNTRLSQVRHLEARSDVKESLKKIAPSYLDQWLQKEALSPTGVAILASHITRFFPEAPESEAAEYASALRVFPAGRMARALIRADLYYNWRCANRGSNPRDLIDDIYHVLNSVHCDVYATSEAKQAEYAGLLLTANTRIAIYDSRRPIDEWLRGLA